MKNIKLSTRIYAQQIIVLLALVAMGLYALINMQKIDTTIEVAHNGYYPMLHEFMAVQELEAREESIFLNEMRLAAAIQIDNNNHELRSAYQKTREDRRSTTRDLDEQREKTLMHIDDFSKSHDISVEESRALHSMAENLKALEKNHNNVKACMDEIEKKLDASISVMTMEDEIQICLHDMEKSFQAMKAMVDESDKGVSEHIQSIQDQALDFTTALMIVVGSVTLIAILMTILTGFALSALRKSVFVISGSVQQVATAAAQSSNAIGLVSDGAKTQTESINQAVTAVEQSVSVLSEVSSSSEKATEIAKVSGQAVTVGKDKMQGMVQVVGRIQDNSNKVNKITEIISGIASQTNMLALNAAIEAARAGEQGKGFAVVADQVKSLAESSKNSVDEIVELIEKAKADAAEAVKVAEIVSAEMDKIEDGVRTTENMMQSISTAMEEQVSTTEELSHNMDTLRDIGTSNANAAEEITETILELSKISNETNEELKRFNI